MIRTFALALLRTALVVGAAGTLSGCWMLFPESDDDTEFPEPAPPPGGGMGRSPTITSIDVPDFPPLSARSEITVECEDSVGLVSLQAMFRDPSRVPLSGIQRSVKLRASELGEGYGLLQLRLQNSRGGTAERAVENLLIDMTPPEVELERAAISPTLEGSQLALSVQDEWVLGFVEVSFRGTTVRHDFPRAYPSSLGSTWDSSRVTFPAASFAEGAGTAMVLVGDAAGNQAMREISLLVDGTAPVVTLTAPTAGQVVAGTLDIDLTARDPNNPTPVDVDVFVNGSLVGSVLGPNGSLSLDTLGMPRGDAQIEAIAYDAAGNASNPVEVQVRLE